jgi:hypothetical protein
LVGFAKCRGYPSWSVRFVQRESFAHKGPLQRLKLQRSPVSVGVDPDLRFDLAFYRLRTGAD